MSTFWTMSKRTTDALVCDGGISMISNKHKKYTSEISCHIDGKSRVFDDEVCSLNLMLQCCNTHPVANQEQQRASTKVKVNCSTIRNVPLHLYLIIPSLASSIVYTVRLPRSGYYYCIFLCVSSSWGQHRFLPYR